MATSCKALIQKWQFGVEIFGTGADALFTKGEAPSVEFDEVGFSPAGSMYDAKFAGRAKFADITLEKGVIPYNGVLSDVETWIEECMAIDESSGDVTLGCPTEYRKDIKVFEYNRDGSLNRTWTLYNAWVKTAKLGEYEGSSSDLVVESITICYDYYKETSSGNNAEKYGNPNAPLA